MRLKQSEAPRRLNVICWGAVVVLVIAALTTCLPSFDRDKEANGAYQANFSAGYLEKHRLVLHPLGFPTFAF